MRSNDVDRIVKLIIDKAANTVISPLRRDMYLWSILTFLRGPDNDNIILKNQTTARVRAIVGFDSTSTIAVNKTPLNPEQREQRNLGLLDMPHFCQHWNMVVHAIRAFYGYDLDKEKIWKGAGQSETATTTKVQ